MNSHILELNQDEIAQTDALAQRVADRFGAASDPVLLADLPFIADGLPQRSRAFLRHFGREEPRGYAIIRGHRVDQDRIGPTPEHWRGRRRPGPEFAEELLQLLYAACLGEPFGWRTQQDAELVHDVFPIRSHETEQLGSGSKELLTWHTEDAFHPHRADFLSLFCLRNPQTAPTTIGELDRSMLDEEDIDILFQERFFIKPDESHLPKNNSTSGGSRELFAMIEKMNSDPDPIAVLFGSKQRPYLRLDPYFMSTPADDPQAAGAFDRLVKVLDTGMEDVVLATGDCIFLNNHLVVHGRKPFTARYDGTDRWLKRVNITSDLRRSRSLRGSASDPIIG